MELKNMKIISIIAMIAAFLAIALFVYGCKETNSETTTNTTSEITREMAHAENTMAETAVSTAVATTEQTLCPVMDAPINKDMFVEYEGKKVYFCCGGCEKMFLENPEEYIAKLPQFQE